MQITIFSFTCDDTCIYLVGGGCIVALALLAVVFRCAYRRWGKPKKAYALHLVQTAHPAVTASTNLTTRSVLLFDEEQPQTVTYGSINDPGDAEAQDFCHEPQKDHHAPVSARRRPKRSPRQR